MTLRTKTLLAALALGLAACATATPYQPADNRGRGFSDQRIEQNRYRVTFQGNTTTDRTTVENYVLFRAAEITLDNGFDHFVILDENTEAFSTFRTTGTTFGGGGFGRRGFFYGGGFGGGFGGFGTTTASTRESRSYLVGVIIETRPGMRPVDDPTAYDARSVIDSLGPVIARPDA